MSFFNELKRRNVFKVAAAYIIVGWLIMQAGDTMAPALHLPEWVNSLLAFFLILGFPLAMFLAWAYEMTPDGIRKEKEIDRSKSITHQTGRKLDFMIIGVMMVALMYFAWDKFVAVPAPEVKPTQTATVAEQAITDTALAQQKPDNNSIAVLPFVNMSSDLEQEYFSDGLAEEILNVLSSVPGLMVTSRTSSFAYKDKDLNIAEIAKELKVRYVVEGSVRRAGDLLRIVTKLIDTTNDEQLWSESFEGDPSEVFAIQDKTANAIQAALNIQLEDTRGNSLRVSGTNNEVAHDVFLKGRYLFHQRGRGEDNMRRAVELFQQATQADPDYAEAYAFLALAKSMGRGQLDIQGAEVALQRAVELDPELPTAWLAQSHVAKSTFNFPEADRALRSVVQLEPRNALAIHFLGVLQFQLERYEEARQLGQRAVDLDPTSPIYRVFLADYCMALGLIDEGITNFFVANQTGIIHNATDQLMWKIVTGDTGGASESLQAFQAAGEKFENLLFINALILIQKGKQQEARKLIIDAPIIDAQNIPDQQAPGPAVITFVHLGEFEAANRVMEAMLEKTGSLSFLKAYLRYLPDLPMEQTRFNELREKIGLPGLDDR